MSPSHVLEPTYIAIKRRLMEARWPAGMRLEAARLADDLGVSVTPVRDSLNRLAGERLVDLRTGDGYRVPRLAGHEFGELIACHQHLVLLAIRGQPSAVSPLDDEVSACPAARALRIFTYLGDVSGNGELAAVVRSLNERVQPARAVEVHFLTGLGAEISEIAALAMAGRASQARLCARIIDYHARRIDQGRLYLRHLDHRLP